MSLKIFDQIVTDSLDTKSSPRKIPPYKERLTFSLIAKDIATEVGDTFDISILAKTPAGTWVSLVAFTQIVGNSADVEELAIINTKNVTSAVLDPTAALAAGSVSNLGIIDEIAVDVVVTKATTTGNESATIEIYVSHE